MTVWLLSISLNEFHILCYLRHKKSLM